MKNKSNVDKWLEKETLQKRKTLEDASRHFDSKDSLTVNILESIYGRESSFGTMRRKRGIKGVAGDFQFEQQTARRLGLSVTKQNDQRFDIDKSSAAAAKYLKIHDDAFREGSSLNSDLKAIAVPDAVERLKFTLAAYNAGEGRIAHAQQVAQLAGEDSTKWDIVKNYLITAGATAAKSKEIQDYVNQVLEDSEEFAKKSKLQTPQESQDHPKGEHWITKDSRHILVKD